MQGGSPVLNFTLPSSIGRASTTPLEAQEFAKGSSKTPFQIQEGSKYEVSRIYKKYSSLAS
jgi:hypothetical protein